MTKVQQTRSQWLRAAGIPPLDISVSPIARCDRSPGANRSPEVPRKSGLPRKVERIRRFTSLCRSGSAHTWDKSFRRGRQQREIAASGRPSVRDLRSSPRLCRSPDSRREKERCHAKEPERSSTEAADWRPAQAQEACEGRKLDDRPVHRANDTQSSGRRGGKQGSASAFRSR